MHENFQEVPNKIQTPKRSLQISPTERQDTPIQEKLKSRKMAGYADKNDIEELKQLIISNTKKIEEEFLHVNNNLLSLKAEITATKNELSSIKLRVKDLEKAKINEDKSSEDILAELNAIKQIELETQLSIHNIPQSIDAKQAVEYLSTWSKIDFNNTTIKRSSIAKPKNKNSSILFLDFYSLASKHKFMNHVKALQKDKDKKYIPILTDHIFKLEQFDAARGLELHFRDAFTDRSREIFNEARKARKIFSGVWVSRGYVMVKINDGNPIRITSLKHLNTVMSDHNQ